MITASPEAPSYEGAVCAGSRRAARRPPPPAASRAAGRTAHSHLCVPAQRAGRAVFTEEASPARAGQGGLAGAGRRRVLPFGVQRRARLRGGERGAADRAASASVTVRARNPGKCPPLRLLLLLGQWPCGHGAASWDSPGCPNSRGDGRGPGGVKGAGSLPGREPRIWAGGGEERAAPAPLSGVAAAQAGVPAFPPPRPLGRVHPGTCGPPAAPETLAGVTGASPSPRAPRRRGYRDTRSQKRALH